MEGKENGFPGGSNSSNLSNLSTDDEYESVKSGNNDEIFDKNNFTRESITSQVSNFTLEATYFLEVFSKFRLRCNSIDSDLSDVLYQIVDSISLFLDGDPSSVPTSDKTISYINFERNTIKKQYFCDICQATVTDTSKALGKHLHCEQHRDGMGVLKNGDTEDIAALKKQRRLEHVIYGNPEIVARILKRKERKEKEKTTQIQKLPKKAKTFMLGNFSNFLQTSLNEAEKIKTAGVLKEISLQLFETLKSRFPAMNIFFFGSRVCGLANENSDMNILIETGITNRYCPTQDVVLEVINVIKYLLKEKSEAWKHCILKEDGKQLSLSARNIKTNVCCDIWVTRYTVHLETLLINHFIENQPIFQDVCLFLKHWMRETGLNKHFSSYILTWMAIFCFQTHRLLPPISFLQVNTPAIMYGPWQINFSKIPLKQFGINPISRDYDTTCYILRKFFQLYSNFDFNRFVVCPFLGYSIERNAFSSFAGLQPQYYAFVLKNPTQILPLKSSVCLQHPLEQNVNIAGNISKGGIKLLQMYCMQSMKILMNKNKPS